MSPVLELEAVGAGYHGVPVVRDINLRVEPGEVVALLGPNGAGKTTVLRTISGTIPAIEGSVSVLGGPTDCKRPHRLAQRGVAHVPEDRSLFPELTVKENLRLAPGIRRRDRAGAYDHAVDLFSALGPLLDRRSGLLSGGEQQMLAIGRALMAEPDFLMIDEVSLGLMPKMVDICYDAIRELKARGMTILLVEQSTKRALDVADHVCVLESGRDVWQGTAADARRDPELIEAYLGLREEAKP